MTDDVKALVEQLEAWAPLVSSGYEVPAAGQTMMNASRALTAQAEEIANLKAANVVFISEHPGKNYPTSQVTKDEAIEMLQARVTVQAEEIERLREIIRLFTGSAYPVSQEINERGYNWSEAYLDLALKAAQEVKA